MIYDVVVIGAGPAGINAAIYAGRYMLKTLVIGVLPGGKAGEAWEICNFLSYEKIRGSEFVQKLLSQLAALKIELKPNLVNTITKKKDYFEIKTDSSNYLAKKVILAMGSDKRKLGVKNEDKFLGKGVSYCATCDASFFKGKQVGVVGGGSAALTSALLISEYASQVHIIYRRASFDKAEPTWVDLVNKNKKIKTIFNVHIQELKGDKKLQSIKLSNDNEILVDGLFIEIGSIPNTDLLKELDLKMEKGYIKTDKNQKTNVSGLFAAGDITNNPLKQIITAASDGAIAATSAYKELQQSK